MRRFLKTLLVVTLTLVLGVLTVGCSIDLSHKHYLNSYGICSQCQKDVSVLLTKNVDGRYVSADIKTDVYNDTIVRFLGDNENGVHITVEANNGAVVGNVKLYSQTSAYITQSTGTAPLIWENKIEQGKMYYVRIQTTGQGTVKVTIKENV